MMTPDKQPQYLRIATEMRARIMSGEWQPGHALPSQQEMIAQYGIALGTVRQVLKELQVSGLVHSRQGKGTFVSDATNLLGQIGLAFVGLPVGDISIPMDSVLGAQQYLAERRIGLALAGFRVDQRDELLAWASSLKGVLLYGLMTQDLVRAVAARGLSVVVLGAVQDGPCPSGVAHVEADVAGCMSLAMEFLTGQGHRRICLINRTISSYYTEIGQAFRQAADEAGMSDSVAELIADEPADEAKLVERLKTLMPAPTALLVEGGRRACRLMPLLADAGWAVPDQMSIMAINGRPAQDLFYPEITRMDLDWARMLQRAVDAMVELIGSGRMIHERTNLRLVWGRTVRHIASTDKAAARTTQDQTLAAVSSAVLERDGACGDASAVSPSVAHTMRALP